MTSGCDHDRFMGECVVFDPCPYCELCAFCGDIEDEHGWPEDYVTKEEEVA